MLGRPTKKQLREALDRQRRTSDRWIAYQAIAQKGLDKATKRANKAEKRVNELEERIEEAHGVTTSKKVHRALGCCEVGE